MRISHRSIEEVRETANLVEVASEFTALRRQGTRYVGLCPYPDHSEKTPSFSVSPERGFYYCFGCQKGGDAIKLVSEMKSLSFVEAVSYLADRSGVQLEYEGSSPAEAEAVKKRTARRRNTYKALAAAAVYYHKYLHKSSNAEQARAYLQTRRFHESTIEEFRLGYAPPRGRSGFIQAMRRLEIGREALDDAGLLSARGGERFAGRITFPIFDRRGRIVGFGARTMGDDQPKYLNTPETDIFNKRDLLYGLPQALEAIRKERAALVVEGYTDVLMLHQVGIKNAVATLGTATTPNHLKTLSGYADKIYVLFDPDAAGEKAIERASATAAELRLDLRVLRLTEDPADWLLEHPAEEFKELLSTAVPVLEYSIRRIVERTRGSDATSRSRAVPEVKSLIQEIRDPVLRREAVRLAAEALGISPRELQSSKTRATTRTSGQRLAVPSDPHLQAGWEVLALILTRPDLTAEPLEKGITSPSLPESLILKPEDFADEEQADIFSVLREHAGEDIDSILSDERIRSRMDQVGALSSEGEKLYPSEASVRQAWLRLGILSRQRAKRGTQDYDAKNRLHEEIQRLKEVLRNNPLES